MGVTFKFIHFIIGRKNFNGKGLPQTDSMAEE